MICLYCNKEFSPNRNNKKQKFCSVACNANYQSKALISYPQLRDKEWLYDQYWVKKISMREIARSLGCAESRVYIFMDKHGISRRTISESSMGNKKSLKHRISLSESAKNRWRGENNPNWRGGIRRKTLEARFSADYGIWRSAVIRKYDSRCAKCGKLLGEVCSCCGQREFKYTHHIKPVKDFPELVTDINNGILLCFLCHKGEHQINIDP